MCQIRKRVINLCSRENNPIITITISAIFTTIIMCPIGGGGAKGMNTLIGGVRRTWPINSVHWPINSVHGLILYAVVSRSVVLQFIKYNRP